MKDAGVDFIQACMDLNGMKTLAQELERQGMGDVPMLHPNTYDAAFVAEAGELFEGDIVGVGFRPFEADPGDSQLADFQQWMEETGSEISELAMVGWINADLAYQGLVAAGPRVRPRERDRGDQRDDRVHRRRAHPPDRLDAGSTSPRPTEDPATHGPRWTALSLVRVDDGEFELIGDPEAPFDCWDGTNHDWSEPEPTNFE